MNRKIVFGAVTVVVVVVGAAFFFLQPRQAEPFVLYGNVDIRQVNLAFEGQERITELQVQEGDVVKKGQLLARQKTDTLTLQLKQAQANEQAAQQAWLILKNGTRPEEVAQRQAAVQAAKARLDLARQELLRVQDIAKTTGGRGISAQQIDKARAQQQVAASEFDSEQKALELALIGPREESVRQAKAQWQAAQAQSEYLELKLSQASLYSPVDGVIRNRLLEVGDIASAQKPVYAISIVSPKWIRAYVSEPHLGWIKPGEKAIVTVDAFPNEKIAGQVGFIASEAQFTPKTVQSPQLRPSLVYEVRIFVEDKDNRLRLGMPATVTFLRR